MLAAIARARPHGSASVECRPALNGRGSTELAPCFLGTGTSTPAFSSSPWSRSISSLATSMYGMNSSFLFFISLTSLFDRGSKLGETRWTEQDRARCDVVRHDHAACMHFDCAWIG